MLLFSYSGATNLLQVPYKSDLMASWVQAVGSITAIVGAFWISNNQHLREMRARGDEKNESQFLLQAELAWLSRDVFNFTNQFYNLKLGIEYGLVIPDDDVSDMLSRLTWCRQRALHREQLAMVGQMRTCVMEIVRVVRMRMAHPPMIFMADEINKMANLRDEAKEIFDSTAKVGFNKRFSQ
ncbi:hypothetical protein [Burkholderia gladioli]|uniref:hypothetical protein n=1 Tax=Burkholderia gladioli TaxID=28095 RepID=UPI00163F3D9E|nr:hypothetical protein [Burkholderia gladioli]